MARTVYCRWCYETGHNRRTCPEYTERLKERAEAEVEANKERADDNQGTYNQIDYANRIKADTLLDGSPHDREVQARLETKRRCSFCAKTDHNRRTCQEFKDSKVTFVERTKLYRELMVEALIEKGIGIGTLMASPSVWADNSVRGDAQMYMVDSIDWDVATIRSATSQANIIHMKNINAHDESYWNRNDRLPFPPPLKLLKKNIKVFSDDPEDWNGFQRTEEFWNNENSYNSTMVVSPIDPEVVKELIPENWTDYDTIDNSAAVKEYFKDMQSPDYYDNKWAD
jgi:hypothetical protein